MIAKAEKVVVTIQNVLVSQAGAWFDTGNLITSRTIEH